MRSHRFRPVAAVLAFLLVLAGVGALLAQLGEDDPSDPAGPPFGQSPGSEAAAPPHTEPQAAPAAVTVHLDEPVATRGSLNGFIHSLDSTQPAPEKVATLLPRLWRSDLSRAPLDRALALGARYQIVLSDLWGYPSSGWQGRGPPWADLARWERFVRRIARRHAGKPLSWDIWNEPNGPEFWSGGRERFLRTYAVANRVLRQELGRDVEIVGPSTSRYSPDWMKVFLDRCLSAACRIAALSWHENLRPDDPLESIGAHLSDARARLLADPRYAPLGLRELHVNEYVGSSDRYLPGEAVHYLAELERGGADLAARSCWTEAECGPAALDGLLSPDDGQPRAVWWAHRWYADGAASRVDSSSSDPALAAMASASPNRVQIVLGNAPQRGPDAPSPPEAKRMELALEGSLPGGGTPVRLRADLLPSTGEAPVRQPASVLEREISPEGGVLRVALPALGAHEAMRVTLE